MTNKKKSFPQVDLKNKMSLFFYSIRFFYFKYWFLMAFFVIFRSKLQGKDGSLLLQSKLYQGMFHKIWKLFDLKTHAKKLCTYCTTAISGWNTFVKTVGCINSCMLEHVYEYERVSACAYLCEMTHGYENTEVGVHYCDWLLKYYAPAHAQMRKKERRGGETKPY